MRLYTHKQMEERLGYYAMNKDNDLFQFCWIKDKFYILTGTDMIESNPDDYEILEIGIYRALVDDLGGKEVSNG